MGDALSLAEVLRQFREQRGMSKRSLSQTSGLSPSYIGKLEAGEIHDLSLRVFLQVALALKLTQAETIFCIRCAMIEVKDANVQN